MDRLDALQKANTELGRKLMEAEKTLQDRLMEHDMELEDMQERLEELKSELTSTKREEKELRSKEVRYCVNLLIISDKCHLANKLNANYCAGVRNCKVAEKFGERTFIISKPAEAIPGAMRWVHFMCLKLLPDTAVVESERYRNQLRRRDQEIKDHQDAAVLHSLEGVKWAKEASSYEDRLAHLEEELSLAQQAHAQLDEQKQENLMLKETIDRMRFDMDEMRNAATNVAAGSGPSSAANSISKSLGAELMGQMGGSWDHEDEVEDEGDSGELEMDENEDTADEEEDVIQTIITRKKRVSSFPRAALMVLIFPAESWSC